MNNCEIKTPRVFSQEIPKWDRNTYADGNAMGAVVEQLFNNTVYNKEELKEKVDTEGGDISETQVSVIDESTETFPVPMSGDKAKGLWGKLKKWQQDCLAKFGNYVLTSMITNQHVNSTSNIPSSALVYLMQQGITQLNRDLATKNPLINVVYEHSITYRLDVNVWSRPLPIYVADGGFYMIHCTLRGPSAGLQIIVDNTDAWSGDRGSGSGQRFVNACCMQWLAAGTNINFGFYSDTASDVYAIARIHKIR